MAKKTATKSKPQESATPPKLGTKRVCNSCGTKFYDFEKSPVICPKCNKEVDINAQVAFRLPEPRKPAKADKESVAEAVLSDDEIPAPGADALDDLADDAEDVVEDIDVDDDDEF